MAEKIDFSECRTILGKAYNGANGKKIAIEYEGHPYMMKCSIFNMLGVKAQETILDSDSGGSGTELDDVIDTIEKQKYIAPEKLTEHFWNVFVIDALLGNFDRHNGNWGFLFDDQADEAVIAPVYDCGSCLLPQADEKINYYDFLKAAENEDCCEAVKRIVPRIHMTEISAFIDDVPYITELQKAFYKRHIEARYELILEPALEMALCDTQAQEQTM